MNTVKKRYWLLFAAIGLIRDVGRCLSETGLFQLFLRIWLQQGHHLTKTLRQMILAVPMSLNLVCDTLTRRIQVGTWVWSVFLSSQPIFRFCRASIRRLNFSNYLLNFRFQNSLI